jgi:hypothetical protein
MVKLIIAMKLKTREYVYFRSAAMSLCSFQHLYVKPCSCSLQDMNLAQFYVCESE